MRILITGICGFVGHALATCLREARGAADLQIVGLDNLSRQGSEVNRLSLRRAGIEVLHGDIRLQSDLEAVGSVDWVVDAAANPSVLAGMDGRTSSRQLVEHNLLGTVNLLEHCRNQGAGFLLLSTSRVYSIAALAELHVEVDGDRYAPRLQEVETHRAISAEGISEDFSTAAPVSLYGATKLASECLALEYHYSFDLPVWINRCGVLAGAGQFGHAAQGIYAYWINAHRQRLPLRYIGFDGRGHQVRDCLHPRDLARLVLLQLEAPRRGGAPKVVNVSGGKASAMSLRQLTEWCDRRFGAHAIGSDRRPRPFDLPWVVLDAACARSTWNWEPAVGVDAILSEIAEHAERNPGWLEISGAV
jgi:CDP-paratose 2-epimerase